MDRAPPAPRANLNVLVARAEQRLNAALARRPPAERADALRAAAAASGLPIELLRALRAEHVVRGAHVDRLRLQALIEYLG